MSRGFIDISLVEAPAVKRGGYGACGKGVNGGKREAGRNCLVGLAKEGGLNEEEDNWIRLQ
eukprot:scaffold229005_cov61-Attheya_sp.AAC.2